MVPIPVIEENQEIQALCEVDGVMEISPKAPIAGVIEAYLASMHPNKKTARGYRRHITKAVDFMSLECLAQLRTIHLVNFHTHLMADGRGMATHAQALIAVRAFLKWTAAMQGHPLKMDQVNYLLKVPKVLVINPHQVLTPDEIKEFLAAAKRSGPRDYALCIVALGSGVRVAELCALDVRDLLADAAGGCTLHVRQGKGSKDRLIPVLPQVREAVQVSLESTYRKAGDVGALFLAEDRHQGGWRLSTKTAGKIVRDTAADAGIRKRITPHALRHTFADSTYLYCRNLVAVKDLLGHSTIATTSRYLAPLDRLDLRKAVPAYLVGGKGPLVLADLSKVK
jgi:site-specific recombinase XerD